MGRGTTIRAYPTVLVLAFLGDRATKGIDRDFMKTLGDRMMPGNAALFLLVDSDDEGTMQQLEA